MKFIALVENLKKAISLAEKAVSKSMSLPILGYFLLSAEKGKVKITATNLEIAIRTEISGKVEKEGSIAMPAKVFAPLVQSIYSDKTEIETEKAARTVVRTSELTFNVQSLGADEFPLIPQVKEENPITIDSKLLSVSLDQVVGAAGVNDLQPQYANILFHYIPNEKIILAATDSHRLAEKIIKKDQFKSNMEKELKILIPARSGQEILRLLSAAGGEVNIFIDKNQMLLKWPDLEFYTRLGEGDFPDYSVIIPKKYESSVKIAKKKLVEGLKSGGLFSSRIQDIKIKIDPAEHRINFETQENSVGTYQANFEAKIDGNELNVAFNWRLLLDGIEKVNSSEVLLGFQNESAPAEIRAEDDPSYRYVLAPLRV